MADRSKEASSRSAQTRSKTISLSMNSPVRFHAIGSVDKLQWPTPGVVKKNDHAKTNVIMPISASLTYWLSTTHRSPGFKSSLSNDLDSAHGIRQRSIMDSKYVASPHHFLLSARDVLLFAASHGAATRGTFNSPHRIALVGCSDNLAILVANLSKSKKSHGPS